jgi:hypothetical protein
MPLGRLVAPTMNVKLDRRIKSPRFSSGSIRNHRAQGDRDGAGGCEMTLATLKDMNFNMNEVPAFHESERFCQT